MKSLEKRIDYSKLLYVSGDKKIYKYKSLHDLFQALSLREMKSIDGDLKQRTFDHVLKSLMLYRVRGTSKTK